MSIVNIEQPNKPITESSKKGGTVEQDFDSRNYLPESNYGQHLHDINGNELP